MESIGEKLRLAREQHTYTLDQVARDTRVARRFLEALEAEDFSAFPGETYAMGFLRTYAEYLGLDADELIGLFRNLQIQEQPLPMNELLDTRRHIPPRLLYLGGGAAVVVLAIVALVLWQVLSPRTGGARAPLAARGAAEEFVFQDQVRTRWFTRGDAIVVPAADRSYRLVVTAIGDTLILTVPGGTVEMGIGKERLIDLDGDARADLRVVWNDVDRTAAERRVNLGLYRVSLAAVETSPAAAGTSTETAAPVTDGATGSATAGSAAPPMRQASFKTLAAARAEAAEEFTVKFRFRSYCLFRFLVDTKEREERFFQQDETFALDAKSRITLWLSNAGAVKATVGGTEYDLGRSGEVGTRTIAWRKDSGSGAYVLEIAPLY
ncbi:MAG: helix-turn-helix domain-containing protein [Spirochaetes bacterium]|nr:helix-turn-helix domain-containing protein [Spirochaetota bacterium]